MGYYDYDNGGYQEDYTVSLVFTNDRATVTVKETITATDRQMAIAKAALHLGASPYAEWRLTEVEVES